MELEAGRSLSERIERLVDWLYPPRCRACGNWIHGPDSNYFCARCRPQIRLVSHPLCTICGRPFLDTSGEDHPCATCLLRAPDYLWARAWACYPREELLEHPLRQVVQKFKYGRKVSLGKPLGRLMARGCQSFLKECFVDVIIPVPLHPGRLRWRGFNQSLLLAQEIGRAYEVPVDAFILQRIRETQPQTQLSEEERRRNVRGAFNVNPKKSIAEKSILLIDDVYTSGATVNECSRVLLRADAKEVFVLTLARTI
jgi:ComF family protein